MDPAVDHGDRELHGRVGARGRRHHLHRGALAPKDATMTTQNARPFPSLAPSRRILAVGLLAGVLALPTTPPGASAATTRRASVERAGNEQIGSVEQIGGVGELDWVALSADGR